MKLNIVLLFFLCGVANPLSCMDVTDLKKKAFQAKFRAAFAARLKAYEEQQQLNPQLHDQSLADELSQLRMKIRQIPGIPDEEPSYFPELLAGSSATFFGANSLAQANTARFILEASAALTAIKLAAAIAASSYLIYKIRNFMKDDEGTKKFRKEYKEDMTAWKREFSHQIGKHHEVQEKFNADIRKDFEDLRAETKTKYDGRKQKTKDMLDKEFATQRKIIKDGLDDATKKIDGKIQEKKDLNAKEREKLAKMIAHLEDQMEKDRAQFDKLLADQKELGKKEKEDLHKMIDDLRGEIDYEKEVRAKQAREVEGLRNAVGLIDKGSYKKFMKELERVKDTMDEQPKRTIVDRMLGRPGHSRGASFGGAGSSPYVQTEGTRSSSVTEGGGSGGQPPLRRRQSGVPRLSLGGLSTTELDQLRESAREIAKSGPDMTQG